MTTSTRLMRSCLLSGMALQEPDPRPVASDIHLADASGWVACDVTVRWKCPFDVAVGSDETMIADYRAWGDDRAGGDETAIPNGGRFLEHGGTVAGQRSLDCVVRVNVSTRTDIDVIADC